MLLKCLEIGFEIKEKENEKRYSLFGLLACSLSRRPTFSRTRSPAHSCFCAGPAARYGPGGQPMQGLTLSFCSANSRGRTLFADEAVPRISVVLYLKSWPSRSPTGEKSVTRARFPWDFLRGAHAQASI
jgi:hypothetical protein